MQDRTLLGRIAGMALVLALFASWPTRAQVSGISYTLTPMGERMQFSSDAGLTDGFLYGGKLGFAFGEFVELSGLYTTSTGLASRPGEVGALSRLAVAGTRRDSQFRRYGAELKFNFTRGRLVPFLALGTGVVRIEPKGLADTESVYLSAGVGAQYRVTSRYTVHAQLASLGYRYTPASALLSGDEASAIPAGSTLEEVRARGLGATVGMAFYLGGRSRGQLTELDQALQAQFRSGLRGLSVRVEPFYSSLRFDETLGYRDSQRMAGVAAGFDLGPYVGLRGFYWRGLDEGSYSSFDKLAAYGGELRLRFEDFGGSLTPHLMVGGGYMNALDGYVGNGVASVKDRPFAMGGFGVYMPLGSAIALHGSVRSVLMSSTSVDDVSTPSSVQSNVMYTGGISFGLGGRGATAGSLIGRDLESARERQDRADEDMARLRFELAQANARIDSLGTVAAIDRAALAASDSSVAEALALAARKSRLVEGASKVDEASVGVADESSDPVERTGVLKGTDRAGRSSVTTDGAGRQWVNLPVPERGEIYVRFGDPGAVTMETVTGGATMMWYDPNTGAFLDQNGRTLDLTSQGPVATKPSSPNEIEAMIRRVLQEELNRTDTPTGATADPAARSERRTDQPSVQPANAGPGKDAPAGTVSPFGSVAVPGAPVGRVDSTALKSIPVDPAKPMTPSADSLRVAPPDSIAVPAQPADSTQKNPLPGNGGGR